MRNVLHWRYHLFIVFSLIRIETGYLTLLNDKRIQIKLLSGPNCNLITCPTNAFCIQFEGDHYSFCHCKCGYAWNSGQTYAEFNCEQVGFGSLITVEIEWYFPVRIHMENDKDYRMIFDFSKIFRAVYFDNGLDIIFIVTLQRNLCMHM